jgi:ATP-binding cassette subfamily B protein/subfamily B ATP-binding cassette protein MsbA
VSQESISRGLVLRSLPRLARYAVRHWPLLLASFGTSFAAAFSAALSPWPMKVLVDNVIGGRPLTGALATLAEALPGTETPRGLAAWAVASTVCLFLLGWLIGLVTSFVTLLLSQRMTFDLAGDMFEGLQRLSMRFHASRGTGDAIRRVTVDSECVATIVLDAALPVTIGLFSMFSMLGLMWQLDASLVPYSLLAIPLMAFALWRYSPRMVQTSIVEQGIEGGLWSQLEQTLSATPIVQAFTGEERAAKEFDKSTAALLEANLATTRAQLWFRIAVGGAGAVVTAFVLWVGSRHVISGSLTLGGILVFLAYLQGFYGPLDTLMSSQATVGGVAGSVSRVREVLDARPDVEDRPNARWVKRANVRGYVAYQQVSFAYEPGRPVLQDVSFEARPGETVALVGPSGAGKTTLVSMMSRFYDPGGGRIMLDGRDIRDIQLRCLRSHVSLVLQEPFLFPISIADNIAYGKPGSSRERIVAAAKAANAHEFICEQPDGYDTVVGERGSTLSGGQRQRISIARALLKDAPILVLDEPTSALDVASEHLLLEALERLMVGRTTLIIAHRLSTIRNADKIVVLEAGRVVEVGSHAELMARKSAYAKMQASQRARTRRRVPVQAG